jgi:hypothetical protein
MTVPFSRITPSIWPFTIGPGAHAPDHQLGAHLLRDRGDGLRGRAAAHDARIRFGNGDGDVVGLDDRPALARFVTGEHFVGTLFFFHRSMVFVMNGSRVARMITSPVSMKERGPEDRSPLLLEQLPAGDGGTGPRGPQFARRAVAVRRADAARLVAARGAGVAGAVLVDEGDADAAGSQVVGGPSAPGAGADDHDMAAVARCERPRSMPRAPGRRKRLAAGRSRRRSNPAPTPAIRRKSRRGRP